MFKICIGRPKSSIFICADCLSSNLKTILSPYDDGSVDSQGNSNGPQIYRANKLKAVGTTTETTMAKVSSLSIILDTAALASEVTSKNVTFSVSPKTIEFESGVDLIEAGFREGDRVLFTATTGGSGNNEI